jgi:hypothetical protein
MRAPGIIFEIAIVGCQREGVDAELGLLFAEEAVEMARKSSIARPEQPRVPVPTPAEMKAAAIADRGMGFNR